MDNVLIVDGDKELLRQMKHYLPKLGQFDIVATSDGNSAIEEMKRKKVSVLATGLNLSSLEGLELLAYISRHYRNVPCIVMSDFGKPWYFKKSDQKENLYYLAKPIQPASISSAILVALGLKDEGSAAKGFGLRHFLPLIEMENRSCRLEVAARGMEKGYLYFESGILIDAHLGTLTPEKAVEEMVRWESVTIAVSELPRMRKQKRLNLSVIELVGATLRETGMTTSTPALANSVELSGTYATRPTPQEIAVEMIMSQLNRYKTIKGYRGVGIVDEDFRPVAGDGLEAALDLANPPVGLDFLFNMTSSTLKVSTGRPCHEITYGNSEVVVQILRSGNENSDRLYILGITDADGNRSFMRHELEAVWKKTEESRPENSDIEFCPTAFPFRSENKNEQNLLKKGNTA